MVEFELIIAISFVSFAAGLMIGLWVKRKEALFWRTKFKALKGVYITPYFRFEEEGESKK